MKMILFLLSVLFFILSIETGSRQAFIGVMLSIFIMMTFYFLNSWKQKKLKLKKYIITFTLLIGMIYLLRKYITDTILWNRLLLLFENNKGDSVNARLTMIEKAKQMFLEAPVFGKGMNGFQENSNSIHAYPHNIIYELLAEYGLIGLLIFTLIILYIIIKSIHLLRKTEINHKKLTMINLLLTLFFISFYFSLISGYLYDSRWIWFYGALIVNYSILKGDTKDENSKYA